MVSAEFLEERIREIDVTIKLLESKVNELPINLATHRLINIKTLLIGELHRVKIAEERNPHLRYAATALLELAGKHADLWDKEDYEAFRQARDVVQSHAGIDSSEIRNIFGYTEDEWRNLDRNIKSKLIYDTEARQ